MQGGLEPLELVLKLRGRIDGDEGGNEKEQWSSSERSRGGIWLHTAPPLHQRPPQSRDVASSGC